MSLFGSLDIAGSGIGAAQEWLNTTAGNIANMDDVSPTDEAAYGAQTPVLPVYCQESSFHVSFPNSPNRGIV